MVFANERTPAALIRTQDTATQTQPQEAKKQETKAYLGGFFGRKKSWRRIIYVYKCKAGWRCKSAFRLWQSPREKHVDLLDTQAFG
jgi:hypothetical protein